jgi:hypothetical protein
MCLFCNNLALGLVIVEWFSHSKLNPTTYHFGVFCTSQYFKYQVTQLEKLKKLGRGLSDFREFRFLFGEGKWIVHTVLCDRISLSFLIRTIRQILWSCLEVSCIPAELFLMTRCQIVHVAIATRCDESNTCDGKSNHIRNNWTANYTCSVLYSPNEYRKKIAASYTSICTCG